MRFLEASASSPHFWHPVPNWDQSSQCVALGIPGMFLSQTTSLFPLQIIPCRVVCRYVVQCCKDLVYPSSGWWAPGSRPVFGVLDLGCGEFPHFLGCKGSSPFSSGSQSGIPGPAAQHHTETWWKCTFLGPASDPEQEIMVLRPRNLAFWKHSQWLWSKPECENLL